MTPRHLILCCAAAALLTSCGDPPAPVVTGAVTDARSGDALADARIHATGRSTRSSRDGYYMLEGVGAGDTLLVTRPGYESSTLILRAEPGEGLKLLRNVTLARIPDTAYTATGPVDVEAFLENRDLTPKKLSPNQARNAAVSTGGADWNRRWPVLKSATIALTFFSVAAPGINLATPSGGTLSAGVAAISNPSN